MGSNQGTAKWNCKMCGNEFTPRPPNYTCPTCNSSNTIPGKSSKAMIQLEEMRRQNEAQRLSQEVRRQQYEAQMLSQSEKRETDPASMLLGIPSHVSYADLTEKLHRHLQTIGVDTKNIKQTKDSNRDEADEGVLSKLRESVDKLPTTKGKLLALAEVEGRSIDRVEVIEILVMVPAKKKGWRREIQYIHEYVVDGVASGFERAHAKPGMFDSLEGSETMIADTKKVEQARDILTKETVGFRWANPNLGFLSRRAPYEDEDRLVRELNDDKALNDELFRLGVYPDIAVCLNVRDGKVSVNHGMGGDVSAFPDSETFGAFDRIAMHIKMVKSSALDR